MPTGLLVPKSDALTTRPRCQVLRGSKKNSTCWTGSPIVDHIRIRIQGKNFGIFYSNTEHRCLSVFGIETISSDEGSMDISGHI